MHTCPFGAPYGRGPLDCSPTCPMDNPALNRSMVGTVQIMNVHICTLVFQDQQRVIQIQQLRDCLSDTLFQNAQLIGQIRDLKVQMAVVSKEKENVQHLCAELIALIDDVSHIYVYMNCDNLLLYWFVQLKLKH